MIRGLPGGFAGLLSPGLSIGSDPEGRVLSGAVGSSRGMDNDPDFASVVRDTQGSERDEAPRKGSATGTEVARDTYADGEEVDGPRSTRQ